MNTLTKREQYNEYISLRDMKPEIGKSGIFFPVSVEHIDLDQYHGDARSFGFCFDYGPCSIVTFEQAAGILADDTIALNEECQAIRKAAAEKKPHHSMLDLMSSEHKCDTGNAKLLIRYGSEYFYKDDHGYFFVTEYFDHGKPQRVTNESAEIYREVNKEYQRMVREYNEKFKVVLKNLDLLRTTVSEEK